MPTQKEILAVLISDVNAASERMANARATVNSIVSEGVDQLPHPDGLHRIMTALSEETLAREALFLAVQRHSGFVLNRITPEDLK